MEVGDVTVALSLELDIQAGQCWCLLGCNGIGKTTLLHTLAGLRVPAAGRIDLNGTPFKQLKRRHIARQLGVLFQNSEDSFPASVFETVLQGRHPHLHSWQWETDKDREIASGALTRLDLGALKNRNVQTLSGGERQRVAIATLLAQQTRLLFLDEPTNHLDLRHSLDILDMLRAECRDKGKAVLIVLHDINLAARFADHILLLLGDGEARSGSKQEILDTALLERLYGCRLIELETHTGTAWVPE
ncbi:MAG TPA: ABC transporter ATP-binding protein [Gammaproteobacteria bacterium]|nr:ABC transporter ATP-binding protein [Gammaproteobacteria bacterium]